MTIFSWIVFGLIAGTIANLIDPAPSTGGVIGSIILGIVGAVTGGFLATLFFGQPINGFNMESLVIAILSALLLLFAQRAFFRPSD